MPRCVASRDAAARERLWNSLQVSRSSSSKSGGHQFGQTRTERRRQKRPDGPLSQLPLDIWQQLLKMMPSARTLLQLCHTSSHIRNVILGETGSLWQEIASSLWDPSSHEKGSWRALHVHQVDVCIRNARMLCSREFKVALRVHYICSKTHGRSVPTFEECDANTGYSAIYNTKKPLSVCLFVDSCGEVVGLGVFVTLRFCAQDEATGEHTRDIRNYIVVKKGQVLNPGMAPRGTQPLAVRSNRKLSSTSSHVNRGDRAQACYRFRLCGENSDLLQALRSRKLCAAVVSKRACIELDPLKHCVGHAMSNIEPVGLTPRQIATLKYTQRLILHRNRGKKTTRLF